MSIGPDLDNKVSLPSCSKDNEGSGNGGNDSNAYCFSTLSLKGPNDAGEVSGPTDFEDVEGMKLGFGSSPKGLELELGQISGGTLDDAALPLLVRSKR